MYDNSSNNDDLELVQKAAEDDSGDESVPTERGLV